MHVKRKWKVKRNTIDSKAKLTDLHYMHYVGDKKRNHSKLCKKTTIIKV